jgi:hypothetical protein
MMEREIYSGRDFLGLVRETSDGHFVAIIGEEVIGPHPTIKAATDALLDVARTGARP